MNLGFLTGYLPNGAPYEVAGSWGCFFSHIRGYMNRFLIKTPWGSIRLHRILRADEERDLHDHPFDFTSVILVGGYTEDRPAEKGRAMCFEYRAGDVIHRKAEDAHIIAHVLPGTLTLVFSGPKRREWGFHSPAGWVHWKEYFRV